MKKSKTPDNLHVLDFKKKRRKKTASSTRTNSFDDLAKKLEHKINTIEDDLKDSMQILESDVQNIIKKNRNESDIKADIENLSHLIEKRVNDSLGKLVESSKSKHNREELKLVQKTSKQLSQILSVDFYKNILQRLEKQETEIEVDEFGMDPAIIPKIRPFFEFLYYKYWRVETTGINNIPNDGRAMIVGNHSGGLPYDGSMIGASIHFEHPVRRDTRFLVEDFVFHMPILGTFMNRIGGIRACPENAQRLLESERLLIVFPEGVKGIGKYYNQRYKLQRFGRGGFVKICIKTKSPLIPTAVVGAEEIHPIIFKSNILAKTIGIPYLPITPTFPLLGLLGIIPYPSKWYIHFGQPIQYNKYSPKTLEDELKIHKLSENVRQEIQAILYELLKKRRSVWLG